MTDLIEKEGLPFLAHLMKRVSDELVRGCAVFYPEFGLRFSPRAASTLRTLDRLGSASIKEIAKAIDQSHPATLDWVNQLKLLGLLETHTDAGDRRRTIASLTEAGRQQAELHRKFDDVIAASYGSLLEEAGADLLEPLWRVEKLGRAKPFEERLRESADKLASWNAAPPNSD
jgi:DNA-binding MarR family transcriptional regulator